MRGDGSHRMERARLLPLILNRDVAQDRGERFRLMMRLFQCARTREWSERAGNFFSGHGSGSQGRPKAADSVLKVYLSDPNLFV